MALSAAQTWPASVELGLRSESGRTRLASCSHNGPLKTGDGLDAIIRFIVTEGMLPERNIDDSRDIWGQSKNT